MPFFKVRIRQDAWINHIGAVEAANKGEAAERAMDAWKGRDELDVPFEEDIAVGFDEGQCDPEDPDDVEEISPCAFDELKGVHALDDV